MNGMSAQRRQRQPVPTHLNLIDGVLLHEKNPIPGAIQTLSLLNQYKIPYIFLTNGGGKPETERVADLNDKLQMQLPLESFIQSHTPFQDLVDGPANLRHKTILVTGSDYEKCRQIMHNYGFQNVVTPADIFAAAPSVFPFQPIANMSQQGKPLPKPLYSAPTWDETTDFSKYLKIDAMFVLNDPRDWALDIQIYADLLQSHQGYVGTFSSPHGKGAKGWQQDGQPALYFSNADLWWSASYHLPRFGQGAFQHSLRGIWGEITNSTAELQSVNFGKPHTETYKFADAVLTKQWETSTQKTLKSLERFMVGADLQGGPAPLEILMDKKKHGGLRLRNVYMLGDNPDSDIAGANLYSRAKDGTSWVSVLVKTGVYDPARKIPFKRDNEPKVIMEDVLSGVRWAMEREGWGAVFEGCRRIE
ncbi:HAD-like domain-containing protein [Podospora australis]|uniref:HAD-like domain-containing protein n=1 Tax=Podospora australis TaxID=1536484 RepID=A0AAN6X1Y8_9PEZI|nr:HAD-like domain-containing protein [Podospora australis]